MACKTFSLTELFMDANLIQAAIAELESLNLYTPQPLELWGLNIAFYNQVLERVGIGKVKLSY